MSRKNGRSSEPSPPRPAPVPYPKPETDGDNGKLFDETNEEEEKHECKRFFWLTTVVEDGIKYDVYKCKECPAKYKTERIKVN